MKCASVNRLSKQLASAFFYNLYVLYKQCRKFDFPCGWSSGTLNTRGGRSVEASAPDFIPPTLWPPNSPDLNPVDFAVCGILQDRIYEGHIKNVEDYVPAQQRRVGWCWSASDWQCSRGMAQETASLHCSWWRTFQTCTLSMYTQGL